MWSQQHNPLNNKGFSHIVISHIAVSPANLTHACLPALNALVHTSWMRTKFAMMLSIAMSVAVPVANAAPVDDGLAAYEAGDYAAALEILMPLAEAGNLDASFTVGRLYDFGQGVGQDDLTAGIWYRVAAEQGMAEAQLALGILFDSGEGVLQSFVEAYAWSAIAADQGLRRAEAFRDTMRSLMSRVDRDTSDRLKTKYWDLYVVPFQN